MLFDNPTFSFSAIHPIVLGNPRRLKIPFFLSKTSSEFQKNLPHPVMPRPNKNYSAREADSRALAIESSQT
jgi:hypothetical protein